MCTIFMEYMKNWNSFKEGLSTELSLSDETLNFLLNPFVKIMVNLIGKTMSVEKKWSIIKKLLDDTSDLSSHIKSYRERLKLKSMDPNFRKELEHKVHLYDSRYKKRGFRINEYKFKIVKYLEDNFISKNNKMDYDWLISKVNDYEYKPKVNLHSFSI